MKSSTLGAILGYFVMCFLNGKLIPALSVDAFIGVAIGLVLGPIFIPILYSFHPSNIGILLDSIGGGQATKGATIGSILGGIFGILLLGYIIANRPINSDSFVTFVFIFIGGGAFLGMLLGAAIQIDKRNKRKKNETKVADSVINMADVEELNSCYHKMSTEDLQHLLEQGDLRPEAIQALTKILEERVRQVAN